MAEQDVHDDGCICHGNWRKIIRDCEHLIGKRFVGHNGDEYLFFGVVHGDDDYYYGMHRKGELMLLSCVGSIEGYGFALAPGMEQGEVREH